MPIETEDTDMIEVYHTRGDRILGISLYTKKELVEIFGKRAAINIIEGRKYTNRKQRITRMSRKAFLQGVK